MNLAPRAAALFSLLLPLIWIPIACNERSESIARPNVVLVTLDTTRPDHMSVYGYTRGTTPGLERMAPESMLYTRAYSTSSWTLPAHASLFTGRLPTSHGARYDPKGPLVLADAMDGSKGLENVRARGLSEEIPTLAEILSAHGYATGAVVAGPWMKRIFGLDRGFAHYVDDRADSLNGAPAGQVTDRAIQWLRTQSQGPFLLFLNYYDAHAPFEPPDPHREAFAIQSDSLAGQMALYDAEIHYVDAELERLFEFLKSKEMWDETLVVVTADHGEQFAEHGIVGHGYSLYDEEIRIPLIVKYPTSDGRTGRSATPVLVSDVFALVLSRLGIARDAETQGQWPPESNRPLVAETYPLPRRGVQGTWRALIQGTTKYLWSDQGRDQLYDLEADPGERHNLALSEPGRARALRAQLDALLAALPRPSEEPTTAIRVDPATQRALESLGYLDEASSGESQP